MKVTPKTMMWFFGLCAIGGLALFLALYQSSPGPLSAAHAKAVPGNMVWSCKKCHAKGGLESGCLSCHAEIAGQLDRGSGFHAYLRKKSNAGCAKCHPEHHGADFPLVSAVSWQGSDTNSFKHPQVDFKLTGKHDKLACAKCHNDKFHKPFSLSHFPDQVRSDTKLGLSQACITCHKDVHGAGDKTRNCAKCHNQDAFKPAPFFNHDKFFVLEGPHAKAKCASCHQQDVKAPPGKFGPVKGKRCADCHKSPHRFEQTLQKDCKACHLGTDEKWSKGQRGVDAAMHSKFGFKLDGAHVKVQCAKCHAPKLPTYAERFPDPATPGYKRRADQCSGCHKDPHAGQFKQQHASCSVCHTTVRFMPATYGPSEHRKTYPLENRHQAVACSQCHKIDSKTKVRRFRGTPSACRACHADPHGGQFRKEIAKSDCTACHRANFTTFRVDSYLHEHTRPFFTGKGHRKATCTQCHVKPADPQQIVQFRKTPTECAACHGDVHRGQFRRNGITRCERCHDSTSKWTVEKFSHDRDSKFVLGPAHTKLACKACHLPVPQLDGEMVVQYRPLTKKCEDCHGFQKK